MHVYVVIYFLLSQEPVAMVPQILPRGLWRDLFQGVATSVRALSEGLFTELLLVFCFCLHICLFVCLQQLEEHCLQDLMYTAVHAQRTGLHSFFAALRKVRKKGGREKLI